MSRLHEQPHGIGTRTTTRLRMLSANDNEDDERGHVEGTSDLSTSNVSELSMELLTSPVLAVRDEPDTDPTSIGKSTGDVRDEQLLNSLGSELVLNNKYVDEVNERSPQLRYRDEPDGSPEAAEPVIFEGDDGSGGNVIHVRERRPSIAESIVSELIYLKELTVSQIKRRRFVVIFIFSVVCISIFNLIFLPRTSLDRDLRRLYSGFVTFDDVSRVFINQLHYRPHIEEYLTGYSKHNHYTGSGYEYELEVLNTFEFITAKSEKYQVYMGTPVESTLTLSDGKETQFETSNLGYMPYSSNSNVSAQYVYANYGLEEDYTLLTKHGIKVNNTIVIIRQKNIHSSELIKSAQNEGAVGVIIYQDPYDDGVVSTKNGYLEFPDGPARNSSNVDTQSGNFIYNQPGDPSTPGWSPYIFDGRTRLTNPLTIPKIPAVGVSYGYVEKILKRLESNGNVSFNWTGDLEFDYIPGPSRNFQLNLHTNIKYSIEPITNLVIEIAGIMGDEEIIIGASGDVSSGQGGVSNTAVTFLEIARGFNELLKRGWKPLRTIRLILWDGSSAGLLGSTEYGEYHKQQLINKCLTYINLDKIQGTSLKVESNPLFDNVIQRVMNTILLGGSTPLSGPVELIGNGMSDYAVFQYHLGIPAINIGYERNSSVDPVAYQNSKDDNLDLLRMFDPQTRLHNIQAQFAGLLALEISDREMFDVALTKYMSIITSSISGCLNNLPDAWMDKNLTYPFEFKQLRDEVLEVNTMIKQLLQLSKTFDKNVEFYRNEIVQDYPWFKLFKKIGTAIQVKRINLKVKAIDKLFVSTPVDSERVWFRHQIYKPSPDHQQVPIPELHDTLSANDFAAFSRALVAMHVALQRAVGVLE